MDELQASLTCIFFFQRLRKKTAEGRLKLTLERVASTITDDDVWGFHSIVPIYTAQLKGKEH